MEPLLYPDDVPHHTRLPGRVLAGRRPYVLSKVKRRECSFVKHAARCHGLEPFKTIWKLSLDGSGCTSFYRRVPWT